MSINKPFRPGDKKVSAATLNAMREGVVSLLDSHGGSNATRSTHPQTVTIRNSTDSDLPAFSVLEIHSSLYMDRADSEWPIDTINNGIELEGAPPSGLEGRKIAVLQEAIPALGLGRAVVSGPTACKIHVSDASYDYRYAEPVSDVSDHLEGAAIGPVRILWKQPGEGLQWAYVIIDNAFRQDVLWLLGSRFPVASGEVFRGEYTFSTREWSETDIPWGSRLFVAQGDYLAKDNPNARYPIVVRPLVDNDGVPPKKHVDGCDYWLFGYDRVNRQLSNTLPWTHSSDIDFMSFRRIMPYTVWTEYQGTCTVNGQQHGYVTIQGTDVRLVAPFRDGASFQPDLYRGDEIMVELIEMVDDTDECPTIAKLVDGPVDAAPGTIRYTVADGVVGRGWEVVPDTEIFPYGIPDVGTIYGGARIAYESGANILDFACPEHCKFIRKIKSPDMW